MGTSERAGEKNEARILVVDDEPGLVDMYADALEGLYDVVTATSGEAALAQLDSDIDAVLLDRRMPNVSGDEVVERIRETGNPCPIAMITAVEPDFDIIEMGFHDYVVKPVGVEELRETVDNLIAIAKYEAKIREYVSLTVKDATLQRIKAADDLAKHDAYQELRAEMRTLSDDLGDWSAEVDPADFDRLLRMVVRSL